LDRYIVWSNAGDNPVVNVSWYDAVGYANWLSRREGEAVSITINADESYSVNLQKGYRLPTEAEWEYAARAGTDWIFSGCNTAEQLGDYAWYGKNSDSRTRPVGRKKPNLFGLYDMSGNVWEWCWDWHGDYPQNAEKDYAGPPGGVYRVLRGGSWFDDYYNCRSAVRNGGDPDVRVSVYGFRVSRHLK
jgi:formylglycine-generating enzyme required for sulfatase activity